MKNMICAVLSGLALIGSAATVQVTTDTVVTDANLSTYTGATGIEIAEGATLSFEGLSSALTLTVPLSGAGTFKMVDSPSLSLKADNSAFTGPYVFTNVFVYVDHAKALGTAGNPVDFAGSSNQDNSRHLSFRVAGTYSNPLTLGRATSEVAGGEHYLYYNALVTNTAPVTLKAYYRFYGNNASSVFLGGVKNLSGANLVLNGALEFHGDAPIDMAGKVFYNDSGTLVYGATGLINAGTFLSAKNTLKFAGPNLLAETQRFQMGIGYGAQSTINLNGFDQRVGQFDHFPYASSRTVSSGKQVITSPTPATFTIKGKVTTATTFEGTIDGAASLALDNTAAVLTIDGGVTGYGPSKVDCSTTGALKAINGTLTLGAHSSFTQLTGLAVSNNAQIVVKTGEINPLGLVVRMGGNGRLTIDPGITLYAQSAYTENGPLEAGTYTKANLSSHLDGDGTLIVRENAAAEYTGTFTWTGAAGTTVLATDTNWKGGVAPGLTTGGEELVFTEGADEARVPSTGGKAYGLRFKSNEAFTLSADTGAFVKLGTGGIAATNSGNKTFTVEPALQLVALPQTWSVVTNTTLKLAGDLSSDNLPYDAMSVEVTGGGILDLAGDNAGLVAPLVFKQTCYPICRTDTALGSPSRTVTLTSMPHFQGHRTNEVPLKLQSTPGGSANWYLTQDSSSSLVQKGPITTSGMTYLIARGGTQLTLEGGVTLGNGGWWQSQNKALFSIVGKPIVGPGQTVTFDNTGDFFLSVTNILAKVQVNKPRIICGAPDILSGLGTLQFSMGGQYSDRNRFGVIDLNGFNQSVTNIICAWDANKGTAATHASVTSSVPATLTLVGAATNDKKDLLFEDQAALHFAGTGTFPLTNALSTTAGELTVSSGTVRFDAGAGWIGSTNVTVKGTGVLQVTAQAAATAFKSADVAGRDMTTCLTLLDTGKMSLDAGATVDVAKLYINGKPMKSGIYGGTGSGAPVILADSFTGTGLLHVWHSDINGTFLIMR